MVSSRPLPGLIARWGWTGLGMLLCALPVMGAAPSLAGWRVYRAADGLSDTYVSTVTRGGQGRVWLTHNDPDRVSWLDGYEVHHLPATGNRNYRLVEGQDGGVWTLSSDGFMVFADGRWQSFVVPDIQREIQSNPIRRVRAISFLSPAAQHVLALLPQKLMDYHFLDNTSTVIKEAKDTGLEMFNEMTASRDGGLWISGGRGVAKTASPTRSGFRDLAWTELVPEAGLGLTNFQWLVEDDDGGLTVVADSVEGKKSYVACYDGERWTKQLMLDGRVRQAWRGEDRSLWARSINALSRIPPGGTEIPEGEGLFGGQIYDVAVESKGAFWLATSEGLVRYAPTLWRSPAARLSPEAGVTSVHAITEDQHHQLWLATSTGLIACQNPDWQFVRFPEDVELVFQPTDLMVGLSDGRLALNSTDHSVVYDPATQRFQRLQSAASRWVRLLGQSRAGEILCQVTYTNLPTRYAQIEKYNGVSFEAICRTPAKWLLGEEILCALVSQGGDLWLGSASGLSLWRDNKWQFFSRADGQVPEAAFCLLETREGRILCGGLDKIHEFDGRSWSVLHSGFDRVNSIIQARDGSLWVAASDGFFHFFNGVWLMNGMEDGLPSSVGYDVYQDSRGVIWAGTTRGFSRYYPDADIEPPRTRIANPNAWSQYFTDEPILLGLSGRDKWKFTATDRLLFSSRIDNYRWLPFERETSVPLNSITPGNHRLEARAMDRNGNIDPTPAVFEFSVVLPWYLETRLLVTSFCGLLAAVFFASLAVNRHLRLKRSYLEIERTVALRTRELEEANKALLHSQKMRALGTLAAGIAHDFNSILSIIKGSAQIIEDNLDNRDKIHTRINRIKAVVDQGAGIVKSLLGFSRLPEEILIPVNVNAVVEDTVRMLGDRFLAGSTIHSDLAPELPEIPCARDLLQQMLVNLVMNAADAMSGRGAIWLRTEVRHELPANLILPPTPADRYTVIRVIDHGCGIAAENQSRIFEPFFTTKSFSARHGTGLGLSMVYEFAKGLGYGLHVESQLGQGSTFTILLPVR